ncbi:hypothetical protein IFM89_036208 [Coptis chinensis]|uniref:Uncharacterized protein n=1 Tax=Coptis chinensis TaxID=261450 RepID=A0A835IVK3_9MAGN|nr:hypothetical protein IFM89_036208 [Coptis chinensis]
MLEESEQPCYLTPWDLSVLSTDYIQRGLLFTKPRDISIKTIIDQLKHSLSFTLTHFFPLSGRLVTKKNLDPPSYYVYIDCKDGPGAEFAHAEADLTTSDILLPIDVPPFVELLFALGRPINYDGHDLPLFAVQVTELIDGIFIGCSFNHAVGDGISFWNFLNTWSEVSRTTGHNIPCISCPPITKRWFVNNQNQIINLPYTHHNEFIERYVAAPFKERMFHFSSQSMAQLKAKANAESNTTKVSSFQALAGLVWRSVTRARGLLADQKTTCWVATNDRSRLDPPLSENYFGNCILALHLTPTAGELLSNNLGWSAMLLHRAVVDHDKVKVRAIIEALTKTPHIFQFGASVNPFSVSFGSSPRFNVYTNDFGWGKPIAVRCGHGNKYDGKVSSYPGREGGGSVDLEICLFSDTMNALELDEEFMNAVTPCPTG